MSLLARRYILLSVGILAISSPAKAEFAMSEMIIDFANGAPRQKDIEIVSQGADTQYIATETYVVENPTEPNEKRTLVSDPQQSGLMITPGKMVLSPGARKLMRFLLIGTPPIDKDKIYRIVVKPVIQGVEEQKQRMALKLLVGYEALVIARPADAKIDLVAERKGNSLTITNKGNTNANLQFGEQCDATGSKCEEVNVARIYAGQTWSTSLPHVDGTVKYRVWDGIEMKEISF